MTPPGDLKARVLAAAAREPAPSRAVVTRRRWVRVAAAALVTLALFALYGGMRAVDRPVPFVLGTAAGWALVAAVATWGSSRGGSMLGRSNRALYLVIAGTPLAIEAWYGGWLARSGLALPAWPIGGSVRCLLATCSMAAAPLGALLVGRRGGDPLHPGSTGAAIGVVAGAWAAVLIDLHCEHVDLVHVTLGHVLPVVVLALAGAAVGRRALAVRGAG